MSFLNEYFDRIYCINLARRTDRWQRCQEVFLEHGLAVERFEAVESSVHGRNSVSAPELGCTLSHMNILDMQISQSIGRVLILEDDVEFVPGMGERFEEAVRTDDLPQHWQLLYLGGNNFVTPAMRRAVGECRYTLSTSSYATTVEGARELRQRCLLFDKQIDMMYVDVQQTVSSWCFRPALAWQRPGYSDVLRTEVDYSQYFSR